MRQRLTIMLTIGAVLGILILLNALSYSQPKQQKESEQLPNRSTYHAGATGARALFDLLSESGYRVTRWREPASKLNSQSGARVTTFVIIGSLLRPISGDEAMSILSWVNRGGRLVIIDRSPNPRLLPRSGNWNIYSEATRQPEYDLDPGNTEQMTEGTAAVHPQQPTLLTRDVRSLKPSRFAAVIRITRPNPAGEKTATRPPAKDAVAIDEESDDEADEKAPPPPKRGPVVVVGTAVDQNATSLSPAPVVHASTDKGPLLIDYAHGAGRIVLLSDPYMVSNGGIKLDDNLQMALNTLTATNGVIAFDEFHQGHAATGNELARYFADTPVLAICGQLTLVVLAMVWTRGRRFGRALPLPQVDRRSSLEFVASMAELQQRARALDLAVENIYARTRRALTRYAGVDYHSSRTEIATRVAARSTLDREQVEGLMRDCEGAINGEPLSERRSIELVSRLRALERALGLRMRSREARQAAENI